MDFSKQTFRCHALGLIMTNPRGKSPMDKYLDALDAMTKKQETYNGMKNKDTVTAKNAVIWMDNKMKEIKELKLHKDDLFLSETCKNYLSDVRILEKYGRKREITNKFTEKGLYREEDAITLLSLFLGELLIKNTVRKDNGIINGEIDIEQEDCITDTKVSWDIFTFFPNLGKALNKLYEWQARGYMWLWNKPKANVAHCLVNTPDHLLAREEKKLIYEIFGDMESFSLATVDERLMYEDLVLQLRKNHIFDDIPINEKVIIRSVERDESYEDMIKKRVEECRLYLNMLEEGKIIDNEEEN